MAVQYVDPNGDDTANWTQAGSPGGASNYQHVDNAVRQPSTDSIDNDYLVSQTNGQVETHDMTTFTASTITSVKVWARCQRLADLSENIATSVYMGGGFEANQDLDPEETTWAWKSVTFSGAWNQVDLDALQVRFTTTRPTGGGVWLSEHYAEITYSGGATSRSHFV